MKFDENLAAVHAYLCADGYVIKNPPEQKHKYYYIGLRNTNIVLLEDFQKRFYEHFRIKPIIVPGQRCKIQNKKLYEILTKDYSYYSYEWTVPELSKRLYTFWLRAFFDCEGWVNNPSNNGRSIALESVNKEEVKKIQKILEKFFIKSKIYKHRHLLQICILGKENLIRYRKSIGFLHPKKRKSLDDAISLYKNYVWDIPSDKPGILDFISKKIRPKKDRNECWIYSIYLSNLVNLKKKLILMRLKAKIFGPWRSSTTEYYAMIIKGDEWRKIKDLN